MFEDGGQLRDFVHVTDVARANELALLGDEPHDGALNVASGSPVTLVDMARVLAGADGRGIEPVVTGQFRIGDVRHVMGDPSRAGAAIGFRAGSDPRTGSSPFASDPLRRPPRTHDRRAAAAGHRPPSSAHRPRLGNGWPRNGPSGWIAVAVVAAAFGVMLWWGQRLADEGVEIFLEAPPFVGQWRVLWSPALWWAVGLAALLVAWWVPAVERLRWGWVLAGSWLWALLWPAVLQWSEGWDSLYTVLGNRRAYLPTAQAIDSPADFLATFVERLPSYPTHVKGHPPGATLAHWFVDLVGGGRSDVLTATFLAVAALAAPASLVALDRLAGRAAARRAAVFAGLAPAAMWIASSPDAMFMGVVACAVAAGAVAVTAERRAAHT